MREREERKLASSAEIGHLCLHINRMKVVRSGSAFTARRLAMKITASIIIMKKLAELSAFSLGSYEFILYESLSTIVQYRFIHYRAGR